MSRLKEFRFCWADAWNNVECGYDTILETTDSGNVYLQCLVNGKSQCIDMTGREDIFISDLEQCNIRDWDKKNYANYDYLDGTRWRLSIAYDDVSIRATGMNGYPKEFRQFIELLTVTWGLQESYICIGEERNFKNMIKGTAVEKMSSYTETISSYSLYY